jgi:hypothetical protein
MERNTERKKSRFDNAPSVKGGMSKWGTGMDFRQCEPILQPLSPQSLKSHPPDRPSSMHDIHPQFRDIPMSDRTAGCPGRYAV